VIGAVVATCAIVVALAVAFLSWRSQRDTARRLAELAERMGDPIPADAGADVAIDRITRSFERVKQRDDDTRTAEVRLEQALDQVTQGVAICDATGTIVARNAFARTFAEARHGEALVDAAVRELLADSLRGARGHREVQLHGPPQRSLQVRASPLHAEHELVGAIAVIDDVSEQKRIESVRRDFVANVSHELKTPIGALALLAETLADEPDPDVVRRLSGRLRDESFRVSDIVDDLLALSRIEAHESLAVASVPVDAVVAEAVVRVRPTADQHQVAIGVVADEPDLHLDADRSQLVSAVANLLDNAVKYSEAGSPVEVRIGATDEHVLIAVRDHGIGIPTRDLERIFERFYRVDKARSRVTGGTGLGLSIVRHVAQNHGGEVEVQSREGEGSTFTLVLPRGGTS
jgi:two-component system sensor histidine kinase SenX3